MKFVAYMSRFQVIELAASSFFPLTFWFFPRTAVYYGGMNAIWSVIGAILAGIFTGWVQGLLNERFPTITGADFQPVTFGPWIGKISTGLYLPIYVLFSAMCVFFFALVMKSFFPFTPRYVIMACMCLVAMRGAWLGVESLGRVASIIHPVTWFGVIVVFFLIIFRAEHHWIPWQMTNWQATANGAYHLYPIYLGFNLFLMLSPYYERRKGQSVWYPVLSAIIGSCGILTAFLAVVFTLGFTSTRDLAFSVPFVLQLVRLQGWIVERLGILIIIFATAYTVLFLSNTIWGMSTAAVRLFNQPDDRYKFMVIPTSIAVLIVGCCFRSEQQAFDILDKYLVPTSWVLLLISPGITLVVAMIRGLRTEPLNIRNSKNG